MATLKEISEREVWSYWTLPLVRKVRAKLNSLIIMDERTPDKEKASGARLAMIGFVQNIIKEAGLSAVEIFPDLAAQSVQQTKKKDKVIEKVIEEGGTVEEFDDELHALETMGLPDNKKGLLEMRKKDVLNSIYREDDGKLVNKAAIEFIGLPATADECGDKYTHRKLVKFIFEERE